MKKNAVFALIAIGSFAVVAFGQTLINGAGATFPFPMYSKWFNEYKKAHPDVQINYQSRGSGAGIQQVTAGTVDFGAADVPMTDMQMQEFTKQRSAEILHFPTVLGAVVPTYDIKGVTATLNFTGDALAGIYLGKITKWNDPAIASANPGVMLPNSDIVVVHRAEASGTSFIWTDYLSKVSPEWKMKVGSGASVNWPVGLGGQGNEGVSGQIKQTGNTIGYVELIYAIQNKMPYGKVKNAAGEFVQADLNSVTAAAAGAAKNMPEDFRVSITNAPGKGAYPISSFTWLLIPAKIADPAKKKAITDFLAWMLKDGQSLTSALSYAPLPKDVVAKETKAIAKIK
ncbi:MAG: phosphate ABC transporter substrate-binding protein PstS [Bryobacterales bacterium]|nr:phosphate ABC transporter substrate-binding protein PstS [Bryobacterales bacterium]MBV9400864.1 phosphate ABC transporter substrate-binding protein PstS [Bryobacterales bacterium]